MFDQYIHYSDRLKFRAVAPSDFDLVFEWENDEENWLQSGVNKPYSPEEIKQYVSKNENLLSDGQTRFMVVLNSNQAIGCADLFAYNKKENEASVGILISKEERQKGYGAETLNSIFAMAKEIYQLKQLKALILADNKASINLFEKMGFVNDETKSNIYYYKDSAYKQLSYIKKL